MKNDWLHQVPGERSLYQALSAGIGILANAGFADPGRPCWFVAVVALGVSLLAGCGSQSSPDSQPAPSQQSITAPSADGSTQNGTQANLTSGQPRRQNERWTDADGREYLGDVPLDVFYDQPYTVALDATPVGGAGPAAAVDTAMMASPGTPASVPDLADSGVSDAQAATSGSTDQAWDELVPASVLNEEVTSIRNFLTQKLQSVGTYNSSMLMIPPRAAAVAVLADIASHHPGEISWKEDALYIRNLAKKMNESTLQRGRKDQSRLLLLFENMTDTFNRSKPAGLEEPPADDTFVDVAEMRFVMMRMEEAERKLKTEAGTESAFGTRKDLIRHEAAILATMSKVVATEGYGYGDDEEFVGYTQQIIDAIGSVENAVSVDDFSSYELALSKISTACQQCHSVYKNN